MWGRRDRSRGTDEAAETAVTPLKAALRQARIDAAERTGVVLDMHDAEAARLDMLNEALDPVFAEVPDEVEIFDRGVSRGEVPRLWIDVLAHVAMGRDKRVYRFVQDTRYGRKVLFESADIAEMTKAVTRYVAGRLIERERALASGTLPVRARAPRRRLRGLLLFLLGVAVGIAALVLAASLAGGLQR
jgi:hypothetical protein